MGLRTQGLETGAGVLREHDVASIHARWIVPGDERSRVHAEGRGRACERLAEARCCEVGEVLPLYDVFAT